MLTITEFSQRIGVSVPTLRNWHSSGKLVPECRTIGGQRRYSEAQAKEYLSSQKLQIAFCKEEESSLMQQYLASLNLNIRLTLNSTEVVDFIVSRKLRSLLVYSTTSFKDFELIQFLCEKYDIDLTVVTEKVEQRPAIKGGDNNVWS